MGIECDYSFEMLYKAAYKKSLTHKLRISLQKLSQDRINELVTTWAQKACWVTNRKKGSDGVIYISFHP